MGLRKHEIKHLHKVLEPYLNHEQSLKMKNFIQHGKTSTYEHCQEVAKMTMYLNRRMRLKGDEKTMLPAAFLHDLYLYDWHIPGPHNRWHGYTHADIAGDNAIRLFNINKHQESIIRTHMWPLNITRVPKTKEAWIVCIADKIISTRETVHRKSKRVQEDIASVVNNI